MKRILYLLTICLSFYQLAAAGNTLKTFPTDTLKKGKNYILYSKSENIGEITISKKRKTKKDAIYIRFGYPTPVPTSNAIKGTVITSKRYKEDDIIPIFDKIDIIKGNYNEVKNDKDTKYKNLFTFTALTFPIRLILHCGKENVDLELSEAGEWNIEIDLKNN